MKFMNTKLDIYITVSLLVFGLTLGVFGHEDTTDSQENIEGDEKSEELVQVITTKGILEGRYRYTRRNVKFASFENVPFAKPPVGDLRFKDPIPAENWKGILKATRKGHYCPQLNMNEMSYIGNEDCLVLNIYTPNIKPKKPLPVLVHISGGGFMLSSDTFFNNPNLFVEDDMILVMTSYRLGALGFMSLESEDVPGNAGFKDQVLALRWIKENIASFGGDPDLITVFGCSAGGISASLLHISEMAKGLLNRVISISSASISDMFLERNPMSRVRDLAKTLGMKPNSDNLLQQFQDEPIESIIIKSGSPGLTSDGVDFPWRFVVEKRFDNVEAFITEEPFKSIERGSFNQIPSIYGYDSIEGVTFYPFTIFSKFFTTGNFVNAKWNITVGSKLHNEVNKRIKKFYMVDKEFDLTNNDVDRELLLSAFNLFGDIVFFRDLDELARLLVRKSTEPVYFYRFSFRGDYLGSPLMRQMELDDGTHGDELHYLFEEVTVDKGSRDYLTRQRIIKLFKNFALTGNPTPDHSDPLLPTTWLPVTETIMNYLEIKDDLTPGTDPDKERSAFWRQLDKYVSMEKSRIKEEL